MIDIDRNEIPPALGLTKIVAPSTVLRLYIAGETPNSVRARANLSAALARNRIADVVRKEEIDVFSAPKRARNDGIIITPTLIICLAGTTVTIVGDLSDTAQLDAQLVRAISDG